ncbi:MAG TPA: adenylate cyclase regulatory domain-containing protein [Mycobacteriales bacterium]|nr:adenylate cyclase regulatory domain-containing protein [Mycobacteriales bacterium]
MTPQELTEAGLYDAAAADADERLELLDFLVSEGCSVEEMQAALARGRLFALAGDRQIKPLVGLLSLTEAATQLECDPADLQRAWRTLGLPDQGIDTPLLTGPDVEAMQTYLDVRTFLGEETALGVARVIGASLARISEAEASAMRQGMDTIDVARTGSEVETAKAFSAVSRLVPRVGRMLDAIHRQHLEATRVHFEVMDIGDRAAFRCGVGFADLSGFTHLSHHLGLAELSQVLSVFEEQAADTVHARGGRTVKFLGDAVMWVAADPGALAGIAHDLVTHPRALMEGIAVRAGIAHGLLLAQDGDYFGTPVNLASRLVATADPGQVLAPAELAEVLGAGWSAVPKEAVVLRGFHDPVEVVELTPSKAG